MPITTLALLFAPRQPAIPSDIPALSISKWINGSKPKPADLKGKVVVIVSTPTFCCGFDAAAKAASDAKKCFPDKVVVYGVFFGKLDAEQKKIWSELQREAKIDWPVGLDEDETYTKKLFPGELPRYTFTYVDKQGKRRNIVSYFSEVAGIVTKLVNE